MYGNVFGIFFFVLGATGIVNAIYINQDNKWNERADSNWDQPFHKKWNYRLRNYRIPFNFTKYRHPYVKEINNPLHHQTDMKYQFQSRVPFHTDYDFHNFWSKHSKSSIFRLSELEKNSAEYLDSSNTYFSDKNSLSSVQPKYEIQKDIHPVIDQKAKKHSKLETVKTVSNNYERPRLSNIDFNYEFLSMPVENSNSELSSQLNEKQTDSTVNTSSKFNTEITQSENIIESETSHKAILQNNESNENNSSTLDLVHRISESKKSFSTEDQHNFSTEKSSENEKFQVTSTLKPNISRKTKSDSYATDPSTFTYFEKNSDTSISQSIIPNTEKKNEHFSVHDSTTSLEIQSTDRKNSETESKMPHSSISSKISQQSFDSFTSKITEETDNLLTKIIGENSIASSTSTTEKTADISTTKLIMSTNKNLPITEETTNDSSYTESTILPRKELVVSVANAITENTNNDISSTQPKISDKESLVALSSIIPHETTTDISIITSAPLTSKDFLVSLKSTVIANAKDLSSSKLAISEKESIYKTIPQDHVIRISSIRTVRVVISTMFLVIALISITVLAVYILQVKRRRVKYDQVLLLP